MKRPRLLLADDHELLIDGLRKLLEPEFDVVEAVVDGRAAVSAFQRLDPDLLLLDVGLPLLNGIEAARQVRQAAPDARILFVTMQTDRIYVEEALRAGACGYVLKQAAARELVEAIRCVLSGKTYLSPWLEQQFGSRLSDTLEDVSRVFGGALTPRQREVLQLIAEGQSMKEMATTLGISVRTVEFHKNSIMEQLGVRSTAELTRYAIDHGIVVESGVKRMGGSR
jgi:DNA-binding NarL/FixJ family response regulator